MIDKAAEAAQRILSDDGEAVTLLEEWLLFSEGALDEKQAAWLYERTRTFIAFM